MLSVFSTSLQMVHADAVPIIRHHFSTDYCTAYAESSRRHPEQIWKYCCKNHDLYYWAGGTLQDRKVIDHELKSCVEKAATKSRANLMYFFVRLGSLSPLKFKNRQWGNAWGEKVRRTSLVPAEIEALSRSLRLTSTLSSNEIEKFSHKLKNR